MKTVFTYNNPAGKNCIAVRPSHQIASLSSTWYTNVNVVKGHIREQEAEYIMDQFKEDYVKD